MQDNTNYSYISTVIDLEQNTHYIKDAEARQAITGLETSKQDKIDSSNKLNAEYVDGLEDVAISGNYDDLKNKPSIPDPVYVDGTMSDSSANPVQNKVVKKYIDDEIASSVASLFDFKGTKQSLSEIQAVAPARKGDVWEDSSTGQEYYCSIDISIATPLAWKDLGKIIDISGLVEREELGGLAFKGSAAGSFTPSGTISIDKYTPEGTVSAPNITVTPDKGTVSSITSVGTLPSLTASVANEILTLAFNPGTLPTKSDNVSVVTGIKSAAATAPDFIGTPKSPTGSFSGTLDVISVE